MDKNKIGKNRELECNFSGDGESIKLNGNVSVSELFIKSLKFNEHSREEISVVTKDLKLISELKRFGWDVRVFNSGYKLKAPEVCLVDLTDPYKFDYFRNKTLLIDYFNFLKGLISSHKLEPLVKSFLKESNFKIISGDSIEFEIRVAGSTDEVFLLKDFLYNYFLDLFPEKYYLESTLCAYHRVPSRSEVFLKSLYSEVGLDVSKTQSSYLIKGGLLPKESFDRYVFIPTSCFKYLFLADQIPFEKVSLVRTHASNSFEIEEYYNLPSVLKGVKVLLIDISYSGKTLNRMEKYFVSKGAIVKKMALFPKSNRAIRDSDYAMILNECFNSRSLEDLSMDQIYLKVKK